MEEYLLYPPFKRVPLWTEAITIGYDGEDAWQEVARCWNGRSPRMPGDPDNPALVDSQEEELV